MQQRINHTPLDTLRNFVSWHPYHFYQLSDPRYTPLNTECSTLVVENAWLGMDMAGRSDMRHKLAAAEHTLREWLHYPPVPMWFTEEHPYTRGPIQLNNGYLLDLGAKVETLLGTVTLTFTDQDGDGLDDTFIGTLSTTATNTDRIVVRVPIADQPLNQREEQDRWNVAPVSVIISGGTLTVSGDIWLIVKPTLYGRPGNQAIDPTVAANYLVTLDVFEVTADSNAVATYTRNGVTVTGPTGGIWVSRDRFTGKIQYIPECGLMWDCGEMPTHMTISYRAGVTDHSLDATICKWALAELSQRICGCEQANKEIQRWQQDRSMQGDDGRFQMRTAGMNNFIGTREGHIQAWYDILKRQQLRGVSTR